MNEHERIINENKDATALIINELLDLRNLVSSYKRVVITQDDDGHSYIIPYEMKEEFIDLLNKLIECDYEDAEILDEYVNKFEQYRTGGDINNIELYIKL